eukprot:gene3993-5718_t
MEELPAINNRTISPSTPAPAPYLSRSTNKPSFISDPAMILALTRRKSAQTPSTPMLITPASNEEKLIDQFKFFRKEFVDAALYMGVTIPMDMVEDKTGHFATFVKNGGLKHVFQIMQSNVEHIHLLRSALSLSLIVITILQRKASAYLRSLLSRDSASFWAADALAKIADSSSVTICIDILVGTSVPSIQELALHLLSIVLTLSSDLIPQMFLPPHNSAISPSSTIAQTPSPEINTGLRKSSSNLGIKETTSLSAAYEDKPSSPNTQIVDFSKFNFKFNTRDYSKPPPPPKPVVNESHSCFSYVLAVIMLEKNRHILMSSLADLILVMLAANNVDNIAYAIAKTPTCQLPLIDTEKSSSHTKATNKASSFVSANQAPKTVPKNPLTGQIVDWAGLKLLLKFLYRYQKITIHRANSIPRDAVSASVRQKEEYSYTHMKVLTAICSLISHSHTVSSYVNGLNGAVQLIQIASTVHQNDEDSNLIILVENCNQVLTQRRRSATGSTHSLPSVESSEQRYYNHFPLPDLTEENTERVSRASSRSPPKTPSRSPSHNRSLTRSQSQSQSRGSSTLQHPMEKISRGSPQKLEKLSEKINLLSNIDKDFKVQYPVETEKNRLYLINSYDNSMAAANEANNDNIIKSKRSSKKLGYNPAKDRIMKNTLKSMDISINKPILPLPEGMVLKNDNRSNNSNNGSDANRGNSPSGGLSSHLFRTFEEEQQQSNNVNDESLIASFSSDENSFASEQSLYFPRKSNNDILLDEMGSPSKNMQRTKSPPAEKYGPDTGYSVKKDLFDKLKDKPVVPRRIEPGDVIKKNEELSAMRQRYQLLARDAVAELSKKGSYKTISKSVQRCEVQQYHQGYDDSIAKNNFIFDAIIMYCFIS